MSLLAELLSKVRGTLEGRKDVPPELNDLVHQEREKVFLSGRLVFLSLLTVCSIAAGFFAAYYLKARIAPAPLPDQAPPGLSLKTKAPRPETVRPLPAARTAVPQSLPANRSEDATTGRAVEPEMQGGPQGISKAASILSHGPGTPSLRETRGGAGEVSPISQGQAPGNPPSAMDGRHVEAPAREKWPDDGEEASYIYGARQFEEQERYPEALAEYWKALKQRPNSPFILNNISYLYLRMGAYENALQYARNALALDRTYVPAMVNAGVSLAGLNRSEEAERLLGRAVDFEPYNRSAVYNLGLLYEKQGKFEEALRMYQDLVKTGDYDARIHVARVFELSGRRDDALGFYREIVTSSLASGPVKREAEKRLGILMQR